VLCTWQLNKTVIEQYINDIPIDNDIREYLLTELNATTNTNITLKIYDGTTIKTKSVTLQFKHKRYWGVSDLENIDNTYVLTNFNSELADNKNKTISFTPNNQYIYYLYPNTWGQASFLINNIPDNNTFQYTTISFTNSQNYTSTFLRYRTRNILNGGVNIQVRDFSHIFYYGVS